MKKTILLLLTSLLLLSGSPLSAAPEKMKPYQGSRIFWDLRSLTTVFSSGNYSRIIQLQDGRLMAVAEALGGIAVSYSTDLGERWTTPERLIQSPEKLFYAVPDVAQLADGTILVGFNPRPHEPYTEDRLFGIRVMRSTDNGQSWEGPHFVFDARHEFINGCWEPSFLELPSGEVHCYFANENEYTYNGDQNISVCRSFDKGLTWSVPETVCYRQGSRDGMPVPILFKDSIAVIVEDNGWPGRGNFAATTVRNSVADNWKKGFVDAGSPYRSMIFETTPPTSIVSAAPYIRRLPWGETVASFQSNEKRASGDLQYFDMYVVVGDDNARNFKAKSAPFSLPKEQHAIWNSVAVVDTGIVLAVGSIGYPNKTNSVRIMKGYPIRRATAAYGSITVDGKTTSGEQWTTKNMSQLFMGNTTKNQTNVDFAFDDRYLYIGARIVDRDLVNTGSRNDGLRFYIDAADVCSRSPQQGMYSFFFDTNGTVAINHGDDGLWKKQPASDDIRYAVEIKSVYYTVEAAMPWSRLGKSTPPSSDDRMAIALEIVNKKEFSEELETIPDVKANESWTWLEFRLAPRRETAASQVSADRVQTYMEGDMLHVECPDEMQEISVFSWDGKALYSNRHVGLSVQIPLSRHGGGILFVKMKNGQTINRKVLF